MTPTAIGLPPGPRLPRLLQTARWGVRPMRFLTECHERYGDVFTVRIAQEGTWVMLADPDHVKQVFTGDPGVYHAGEANTILLPLVGDHSVLLLDDEAHMSQRKLMLPPFHGKRMERYGELMREIAVAEVERWPHGEPFALQPRMQALTLEVIVRAVLGVEEEAELDRIRSGLRELLEDVMHPQAAVLIGLLGPHRFRRLPMVRQAMAPSNRLLHDLIDRRRAESNLEEREDILSLLLQATARGRLADDRRRAARRAGDAARGRPRDHGHRAVMGGRAAGAPPRQARAAPRRGPRGRGRLPRRRRQGDAPPAPRDPDRGRASSPSPSRSAAGTFPPACGWRPASTWSTGARTSTPSRTRFRPERFLEEPAGTYTWIPFGGGVRRCLGASFAMFEMNQVLAAIVERLDLQAPAPDSERLRRRQITWAPQRGGEVVAA